jgi:hypothetical protein
MMTRRFVHVAVLALAAAGVSHGQSGPAPEVPADIAAALAEHLGKWRSEGTLVVNGVTVAAAATWECTAAVGGIGLICTWLHEWGGGASDRAVDLVGYDPASGTLLFTRVTDRGVASAGSVTVSGLTLVRRWEGTQDGKPLVGRNEVHMAPGDGGDWTQRMTVEVGGETVTDMRITHHRVR